MNSPPRLIRLNLVRSTKSKQSTRKRAGAFQDPRIAPLAAQRPASSPMGGVAYPCCQNPMRVAALDARRCAYAGFAGRLARSALPCCRVDDFGRTQEYDDGRNETVRVCSQTTACDRRPHDAKVLYPGRRRSPGELGATRCRTSCKVGGFFAVRPRNR